MKVDARRADVPTLSVTAKKGSSIVGGVHSFIHSFSPAFDASIRGVTAFSQTFSPLSLSYLRDLREVGVGDRAIDHRDANRGKASRERRAHLPSAHARA